MSCAQVRYFVRNRRFSKSNNRTISYVILFRNNSFLAFTFRKMSKKMPIKYTAIHTDSNYKRRFNRSSSSWCRLGWVRFPVPTVRRRIPPDPLKNSSPGDSRPLTISSDFVTSGLRTPVYIYSPLGVRTCLIGSV